MIEEAQAKVAEVDARLSANDDPATREYAERTLQRTLVEVEKILPFLRPLMDSARRDDVPLGMLVALDSAIEALLPQGADPIVHFDNAHMYSTLDLSEALSRPTELKPTPVAFFVPVLDPFNALLMPLLVHEIGHTAIFQASLGSATMSLASADLNDLLAQHFSGAETETLFRSQTQLVGWVDELLCDSLAAAVCGPSYLFAAASFLPATAQDDPASSHPFPSERLRTVLESLTRAGWGDFLAATCPETAEWLRQQAAPSAPANQQEEFLRSACSVLVPAIESTIAGHVQTPIDADAYYTLAPEAMGQLRMRVPPSEVDQQPIGPWEILVVGWQWFFQMHGDSPATLVEATRDLELSRVLLRAIEMSQIRQLWSDSDAV
ncbi:hypothetical protein [Candidatus Poriferisodalis sp.]|uniref:hypothetical protein n=1 Tax=Candidatus Poriferisodalis sp. TaxID=3101277 RepID=UPI003B01FBBA